MECKNCKAQLEPDVYICPQCGTDNTPECAADSAPECSTDNTPEAPKGILLTPGKLVLIIGAVVVVTALVVALILQGAGFRFGNTQETLPVEPLETIGDIVYTVPTDGSPDDVTCKGSYTAADEAVLAAGDTVVATVGEDTLTVSELQIYYWMQVQSFLGSEYGSYAAYLGLDLTRPLDTQVCGISTDGVTWQQYFLAAALSDWHNYQALAREAKLNGFTLEENYVTMIEELPQTLETDAGVQGFDSAESFLKFNIGGGASIADYQSYMRTYYEGFMYFQDKYESMIPTDEELEEYYLEHQADYQEQGVNQDDIYVDVRHILVLPEGATVDTIYTETFSEEAWAVGEKNAQEILDRWLAGEKTEESFAALAEEESQDPGSNTNGGLYTDVTLGMMVEEFEAWCFDESRQVGDYGIVKTDLGYHIMYFSGSRPVWRDYAESDLLGDRGMELIYATTDKHPMTVDYSKILLADAHPEKW